MNVPMNARSQKRSVPSILPILGVASLIRLLGLSGRPMWYDEALTVMQAERGLASMLYGTPSAESGIAANVQPILYHTVLWIWEQIVGTEPSSVRLLSVLVGLGVVVVGYLLARQLFADRVATLTGWALTLSPFQVHYSQEARMYALLALLLMSATLVYWRAVHRGRWIHWLMFAVLAAAAEYTHSLAAVYLIPLCATAVILRRWKQVLYTIEAGAVALLLYLPWRLYMSSRPAPGLQGFDVSRPEIADLIRTLLVFFAGFPIPQWAISLAVFSAVFLMVLAVVTTARERRANPVLTRRAVWIVYLGTAPVGLMFLVSMYRPAYLDRAMLAAGAIFLTWVVWALDRKALVPGMVYLGYAALCATFVVGLFGFFSYRGYPYAPYQELDGYLDDNVRPGEVILHSSKLSAIPASYYDPRLAQTFLADPPQGGPSLPSQTTQEILGIRAADDVQTAVEDAQGVWFVIFPGELQENASGGTTQYLALAWLNARYSIDRVEWFGELQVYHYVLAGEGSIPALPNDT